MTGSKSETLPV